MALRKIIIKGDETLTKKSRPVERFDKRLHSLLDDMAETLHEAEGVGLAAPQVNVLRRVVVIDMGEGVIELVNPRIIEKEGIQNELEGCLSVPGTCVITERPMKVRVAAQDRNGNEFEAEGEGLSARAFCHEIDHLDGRLITDHGRIMTEQEVKEYYEKRGVKTDD